MLYPIFLTSSCTPPPHKLLHHLPRQGKTQPPSASPPSPPYQGRQFTSNLWDHACKALGIHHGTTTAYHPQCNGMVERTHRQLKDALKACLAAAKWPKHLPWVLLGLRTAPKEDIGISLADLVYGAQPALPAQLTSNTELQAELGTRSLFPGSLSAHFISMDCSFCQFSGSLIAQSL